MLDRRHLLEQLLPQSELLLSLVLSEVAQKAIDLVLVNLGVESELKLLALVKQVSFLCFPDVKIVQLLPGDFDIS